MNEKLFNFNPEAYKILQAHRLSVNELYTVYLAEQEQELEGYGFKFASFRETCYRNGYITQDGLITVKGKDLLAEIRGETKIAEEPKKEPDFERWWKVFPANDRHGNFDATRSLKVNKQKCKKLFDTIMNEGNYTIQDMIEALGDEVRDKMKASVKENKMSYMSSTEPYLNKRVFEGFIKQEKREEVKKEIISHKDLF